MVLTSLRFPFNLQWTLAVSLFPSLVLHLSNLCNVNCSLHLLTGVVLLDLQQCRWLAPKEEWKISSFSIVVPFFFLLFLFLFLYYCWRFFDAFIHLNLLEVELLQCFWAGFWAVELPPTLYVAQVYIRTNFCNLCVPVLQSCAFGIWVHYSM